MENRLDDYAGAASQLRPARFLLSSRQWTPWSGTGRVTWRVDFPVFGASARPPGGRTGEVSSGLEGGAKLKAERSRFSPDNVGLFSAATHRAHQDWRRNASGVRGTEKEGLIPKRSKQRLDSTHVLSAVSDLSALECVRETLRLALEELGRGLAKSERPDFWELFWERYVESKLDYKSGQEVLKNKHRQAGEDCLRLLQWLEPMAIGVAIGIASYTAPLYISEVAPPNLRGGLVTLNQLAVTMGILLAYVVDAVFSGSGNWRIMFGCGVFPAVALGLGIAVLPESPRWLLLHRQKAKALQVLARLRGPKEIQAEVNDIVL